MNSILPLPGLPSPDCVDEALGRLGSYLEAELDSLEHLLLLAGRSIADVAVLRQLHLFDNATGTDELRLLTLARSCIERLLGEVRSIDTDGAFGVPVPPDFDAGVRWAGARLEDILHEL